MRSRALCGTRAGLLLATIGVLFAHGCHAGAGAAESVARRALPINGGLLETGQPAVMLITHYSGFGCTGTLIGRRVLLTAKHCVQNESGVKFNIDYYEIGVGPNQYAISHTYGVSESRTTAGAAIEDSDVAVLILSEAAVETPYRYKFELDSSAAFEGTVATLIGYGVDNCPDGDSGTKLRTDDPVVGWQSSNDFVTQGRGANSGDSGGPVFEAATMEVMGVISRGDGACTGYTVATRVDAWRSLINQALIDTGDCAPSAAVDVCGDGQDNDCNGSIDDGCAANGTACVEASECASKQCQDLGWGNICTSPCDPLEPAGECGTGQFCKLVACDSGFCVPGGPGTKPIGDACADDIECASLLCRGLGTGGNRCVTPCAVDRGGCLGDEACVGFDAGSICGGCVPAEEAPTPRNVGAPCDNAGECASGYCLDDQGFGYCTRACGTDPPCPFGFHCRDGVCAMGTLGQAGEPCLGDPDCDPSLACYGATAEAAGYCTRACGDGSGCPTGTTCDGVACVVDKLPLGEPCTATTACRSLACLTFGGRAACTQPCDRQSPCPALMTCQLADDDRPYCRPNDLPAPIVNPKPGGCTTAGGADDLGVALLVILILLVFPLGRCRRRR